MGGVGRWGGRAREGGGRSATILRYCLTVRGTSSLSVCLSVPVCLSVCLSLNS